MDKSKPTTKQYGVWETDGECSYWTLHDTIEDAVSSQGGGKVEVYRLTARTIGTFKSAVKCVRIRKRKRSKK